ncbi:MAG: hypothetical protein NOF05_14055 [Candidatus Accumulibacter phosphatis]|uniref:Uncharacterized protein n=2 Tax=Candidatus Accumulibacter cognatus TaxID=2954383 RepID=A0A7D5NB04_9PROT|nr:hypothetical protein [Accumulibacter sp.]MCQ1549904.1 hypothetical protein [Candidatus Accumulibacter phosphatis]QLH50334.1 MAG: hypothetical protein HWD57_11475 [Candidatus Accumulibacter cognatus]HMV58785.1 hypothetical protein [Nitrospira sp.]MBN8517490.1 hypothetical protein [Accumulibacter sp.]MBO3711623.1 hypothetical protein [Accumulibacter sp.]
MGEEMKSRSMISRGCFSAFKLRVIVFVSIFMGMLTVASAQPAGDITKEEMALIPPYCPYAQLFPKHNTSERLQWEARLGREGFQAIHHYCWGQINLQRALRSRTSASERKFLLKTVVADYQFVIRHVDGHARDFVLLPEILTRKGEAELLRSDFQDANISFARARAIKPDYWPAYSAWAEFLIRSGQKVAAKQLVKSGLEYSPGARVLRDQYQSLGGDLSDIKPIRKPPPPESIAEESKESKQTGEEIPEINSADPPSEGSPQH